MAPAFRWSHFLKVPLLSCLVVMFDISLHSVFTLVEGFLDSRKVTKNQMRFTSRAAMHIPIIPRELGKESVRKPSSNTIPKTAILISIPKLQKIAIIYRMASNLIL